MSDNNRFGNEPDRGNGPLQSQTGSEPGRRSAEYNDDLTSEQAPAGSASPEQASSWNDTASGIQSSSVGQGGSGFGAGTDAGSVSGNSSGGMSGGYVGTGATSATGGSTLGGSSTGGSTLGGSSTGGSTLGGSATGGSDDRSDSLSSSRDLGDNTDGLGRDQTDRVTADETGTLISADKVQGTAVYDASGERLGTIDSLMLNKRSGKVAYAVMSFGGFLGIGERYHPLPWDKLTYDTEKGGYNVGSTQDELRAGPTYSRDELDELEGGRRGSNEIDDYYAQSALGGGITRSGGIPIV